MAFKPIVSGTNPLASDVQQIIAALTGSHDVSAISLYAEISAPGALTAVVNHVAGSLNGAYSYKVTLVTGYVDSDGTVHLNNETEGGTTSGGVNPANEKVDLSNLPVGPAGTVARRIYRTVAGGATHKLVTTIQDNATLTYTDNVADGDLGADAPTVNTTGTKLISELPINLLAPGGGVRSYISFRQAGTKAFRFGLDDSANLVIQRWSGGAWVTAWTILAADGSLQGAATRIAGLGAPAADADAATKNYVDDLELRMTYKVRW